MRGDRLILPPSSLAGCLFGTILRDTIGRELTHGQRFNHFPASPLVSISWFLEGASHAVEAGKPLTTPLPRLLFAGPQSGPLSSWNPGPVKAMTLGIYPEAWQVLTGLDVIPQVDRVCALDEVLSGPLLDVFMRLLQFGPMDGLQGLQAQLQALWSDVQPSTPGQKLGDWSRALAVRAAMSGAGRSLRQAQRRMKRWTGQSQRSLETYARVDALHQLSRVGDVDLVGLAQIAGFSDQSHMGRDLRRVTGFSPARLQTAIACDEAFWAYRLLGQRF